MRALDRKVLRDLWRLRSQVLAIGAVIASGVAVLVMSLSTLDALFATTDAYYDRYRLAEVFASLKRAPEHVADRIRAIDGVRTVETRVVGYATLDLEGFAEPVMGKLVSVPAGDEPLLNRLVIRSGRSVEFGATDEVVLNEPFADAHGLGPGDRLRAVLRGNRRTLRVVGVALSPEYIYSLAPGALMPDDERFGVLWMGRETLEAAYDLDGAFNQVSLELDRGVDPTPVIRRLDRVLERYGGLGAIPRADQLSNWFVMNEIEQLETMSEILPAIFLVVSAFLTNMVLGRLIATERPQIGLLKAFGYTNTQVGAHYTKMVLGIAVVGIVFGMLLGSWLGRMNTQMYAQVFRFPLLLYRPSADGFGIAALASVAAALAGAATSVLRAANLPPAAAMQPPAPPLFRHRRPRRTRTFAWLDQPTRIILRNIVRWPHRAGLTIVGLAASVGLLVLALQWSDSIAYLADTYFFQAQRQHVMVGLAETRSTTVLRDFEHLPGVLSAEPMRMVRADFTVGTARHRGSVTGVTGDAHLQPIYDDLRDAIVEPPEDGLVLASALADKLGVGPGDLVDLRVLEGRRPEVRLPVVALVETWIGMPAWMHAAALDRLMKERASTGYVNLLVDRTREAELYRELKELPMASAVMLRQAAIDSFYETIAEHLMVFVSMFSALACVLGFGVAYNSTRIALSERGRELATLRVLGFSRAETAYILLGEVAVLAAVALPVGCVLGTWLSGLMTALFRTELYRVPFVIEPSTYGTAALVAIGSTAASMVVVGRRIARLDLIEVLKTRE